ncbi:uncharacterized protein V1518DRAFT_419555 [Limtongia smithiae]|uniref:uncharacterized protein n=1 Tax=Limtongia smithiae TaxID=1125753 RepID=UPI0034CE736C
MAQPSGAQVSAASATLALPAGDDVQTIYYLYSIAAGHEPAPPNLRLDAYSRILAYSRPAADVRARSLASSFIPDLFAGFADSPAVASRAVESMIDFCEDTNAKLRIDAIRRLPAVASHSKSDADKVVLVDILVQLLQATAAPELAAVRSSLQQIATLLPDITARQVWTLASAESEPVLQKIALNWIVSSGASLLSASDVFLTSAVTVLRKVSSLDTIKTILPAASTALTARSAKHSDSVPRHATELLDVLVSKIPTPFADTSAVADYVAFLSTSVTPLFKFHASANSLLKFLATTATPALLDSNVTATPTIRTLLRLAVESVATVPASPEVSIFIPKLKDLAIWQAGKLPDPAAAATPTAAPTTDWLIVEPLCIALYIAIRRTPSYPLSTDASTDLTPALRSICFNAQIDAPILRKQQAAATEDVAVETLRLACANVLEITREMLKLPALRSQTPPAIKFSWRPRTVPAAPAQPKSAIAVATGPAAESKRAKKRKVTVAAAAAASASATPAASATAPGPSPSAPTEPKSKKSKKWKQK